MKIELTKEDVLTIIYALDFQDETHPRTYRNKRLIDYLTYCLRNV